MRLMPLRQHTKTAQIPQLPKGSSSKISEYRVVNAGNLDTQSVEILKGGYRVHWSLEIIQLKSV